MTPEERASQAASVYFVEGSTELTAVSVQYSAPNSGSTTEWFGSLPPTTDSTTESGTFTGYMSGAYSTGKYAFGLQEPTTGQLSDWVTIDWSQETIVGFGTFTKFVMNFRSDTEGQILQPPSGYTPGEFRLEDGTLQIFSTPLTFLSVGVKSDLEVPEPSTFALISLGAASLIEMRRRDGQPVR
jgi:hypothetical protein